MNYQYVNIIGHLGRDNELKYTPSGTAYLNNTVAETRKWKDKEGNAKEKTAWIPVALFGPQAERFAEWTRKGTNVNLVGRLESDTYEDPKTKEKRTSIKMMINNFFVVPPVQKAAADQAPAPRPAPKPVDPSEDGPPPDWN